MGIIFVAGVHGVGKTTACTEAAKLLNSKSYSASQLIRSEKEEAISNKVKQVKDIGGNQKLLINAVSKLLQETQKPIILDGHFTLLNSLNNCEAIGIELFEQLPLIEIILFKDKPQKIFDRIRLRDGNSFSIEEIKHHQEKEIYEAKYIASTLNIKLKILNAFDIESLKNTVACYI